MLLSSFTCEINKGLILMVVNFTDKTSTTIQIDVSMVYSLEISCSEPYQAALKTKLMADFQNDVFHVWNNVCSTSACENVQISSNCVPASKQLKVALKIRNLRFDINFPLIALKSLFLKKKKDS